MQKYAQISSAMAFSIYWIRTIFAGGGDTQNCRGKPSMYRRSAISTLSFSHILTLVYIRVAYIQDGTKPG